MSSPTIAIINASAACTDAEVASMVPALQSQVDNDFAPFWNGLRADLVFVGHSDTPPAGAWQLAILDDATQAGILGYHDLTKDGHPLGKAFAGTDKRVGASVSVTVSHELLEMLADPWITLMVDASTAAKAQMYAYEVCDAVEDDSLGYLVDGILVSDFVTPAWFEAKRKARSTTFDFKGHVTAPFALAKGGYISVYIPGRGWTQKTAEECPSPSTRGAVGSRRERRQVLHDHRSLSKV